jgi:hypothetical protein
MLYPPELVDKPTASFDAMDNLFLLIRKSLPWTINPLERWYNNNSNNFSKSRLVANLTSRLFVNSTQVQTYLRSTDYLNLVNGTTNIRVNSSKAFNDLRTFRNSFASQAVMQRNYNQYAVTNREDIPSLNVTGD